jgi:hypothetical protein
MVIRAQQRGRAVLGALLGATALAGAGAALPRAAQGDAVASGTLALRFEVSVRYPGTACPAGSPVNLQCFARAGNAIVPGLGAVAESYDYALENAPEGCPTPAEGDSLRLPPTTARLVVAGKGEIDISTAGTGCVARSGTFQPSEPFTITGGSGTYAGATGGGTVTTTSYGPPSFSGADAWTGTLVVPGVDFDLTPPVLTGAHSKTVHVPRRLKRVRVAYAVTARDAVDGTLPVTCRPRSRSWFGVGRTRVRCIATDTSGNIRTVTFVVTVKRRK